MTHWQVGDLALCIKQSGHWRCLTPGASPPSKCPEAGEIYTVDEVAWHEDEAYLYFSVYPGDDWLAIHFIRVTPGAHPGEAEVERRHMAPRKRETTT